MKLQVLADIHLEFASFDVPDTDADVVARAGDIGTKLGGIELANRLGKPVIYVAGNHEYYGDALPKLTDKMRAAAGPNVAFLENDEVIIGDVRFLGATLWTDFRLFGDAAKDYSMLVAGERMNDFRKIRCSPKYNRLSPLATAVLHRQTRQWLRTALQRDHAGPTVVVTHHAPSIRSSGPTVSLGTADQGLAVGSARSGIRRWRTASVSGIPRPTQATASADQPWPERHDEWDALDTQDGRGVM